MQCSRRKKHALRRLFFKKQFVYFIKCIEILGSLWYNSTHNETGGLLYPAGA